VMTIVVLYVGKLTDSRNKQSILKIGTIISLVSWVTRFFSHTPLGVFFAETITRIGRNITQVPLLTLTYDQARRETVMDRVIFFEMTLIVGKLLAMGILLLLFLVVPQEWFWNIAFALAGIMTLLYGLL